MVTRKRIGNRSFVCTKDLRFTNSKTREEHIITKGTQVFARGSSRKLDCIYVYEYPLHTNSKIALTVDMFLEYFD